MKKTILVSLIFLIATSISAHKGRTDKNGCHKDKKSGTTHCH
jgi:hypothetical protein